MPADVKQIIFICVLFYFELGVPRGTLRVSGKQNSLFPLGPVIKCLISLFCDVVVGVAVVISSTPY